ncbi:MAG: AEC family transporter [Eubacteriales bacterium]|nr:AEC family transporter [Eubacteriales bacterium]
MTYALIILKQIIALFVYAAIGYFMHRGKLLNREGVRSMSNLLLYILLPCVIVNSFCRESTPEVTRALGYSFVLGALLHGVAILISELLFHKAPLDSFSASFSNIGYIGVPLIVAALGEDAVLYAVGMIAMLNVLQWTYGQRMLTRDTGAFQWKKAFINPLVISVTIGLFFYFLPIEMPPLLHNCVSAVADCNSPIAMVILGYYVHEIPFKQMFTLPAAYAVSAVRLLLIPLCSLLLLAWLPVSSDIKLALMLSAASPVGVNAAIYAERTGHDYARAVIMVCLSTLLSLLSMTFLIWLSAKLF